MTTFRERADVATIAWKATTPTLPDSARPAACYRGAVGTKEHPVCVPTEHAELNLLPEARAIALDRFERIGINPLLDDGEPVSLSK